MTEPCIPQIDALKLVRDGTAQRGRFPAALDPATVPVDGRGPAESMLFAREYAAFLRYYSEKNETHEGADWREFFSADPSVALAAASVQDVDRYREILRKCFAALDDLELADSPETVRRHLGFIFGAVGTLATQLDLLKERLPADIALKGTLTTLIKTRLADKLKRLVSYYNADQAPPEPPLIEPALELPQPEEDYQLSILGANPVSFRAMLTRAVPEGQTPLSETWWATPNGSGRWEDFANVPAQASVFGDPAGTPFQRAGACASHALFAGACDQFLMVYARVVKEAKAELQATLGEFRKHAPHYTLFLAFLEMLEFARTEINALGGKHLDFYYRDVLRLTEKPAEPAHAHVVVELSKSASTHELPIGTELKAGKDASGKTVVFTTDEALVANKAVVASVSCLHRHVDEQAGTDAIHVDSDPRIAGAAWHPFECQGEIGSFGFAIASHYLYLAEGTRLVTLELTVGKCDDAELVAGLKSALVCRFTTQDGWLEVEPRTTALSGAVLSITIELTGAEPAITAYDAKQHASSYDVTLPILEVRLKAVDGMLATFAALEEVTVTSIELAVAVTGFRSLSISTDLGPADTSKPFQPFGPAPVKGNALTIGCQEAFSKRGLEQFELALAWRDRTAGPAPVAVQSLTKGKWESAAGTTSILTGDQERVSLASKLKEFNPEDEPALVFPAPFGLAANSGYLRLVLQASFGHEDYAARVAQYVIDSINGDSKLTGLINAARNLAFVQAETSRRIDELTEELDIAKEVDTGTQLEHVLQPELVAPQTTSTTGFPAEPYTPELESITLDYKASQTIDCAASDETAYGDRTARFFHVTPFGLAEQHAWLRVGSSEPLITLLPQLRHRDEKNLPVPHAGELYVGLDAVAAPQNVALLFQVEDGSADPLSEKPSPHLHFSYLMAGDWREFETDEVDDRTSELMSSGIITFSIPAEATTNDTLLPGARTWIRIAVAANTESVCRLFSVTAQGVRATFSDRKNDSTLFATPLSAGTITKLVTPVAAVKSLTQPYASYGSRSKESARDFTTRVSERLRHKNRAIALWDFERLVLEAFPAIHRVKCQNHTCYQPDPSGVGVYRELAPGHVTVVAIPAVSKGYSSDPLTPYTSSSTLGEIEELLRQRSSCFATLHVGNPAYERLRVSCKVKLREGADESYTVSCLQTAITRFLAPWAFDPTARPSFSGKVHASALIDFVEAQKDVDYLTDFCLQRKVDAGFSEALAVAEGTSSVSVLTSVSESEHSIEVIDEPEAVRVGETCQCAP